MKRTILARCAPRTWLAALTLALTVAAASGVGGGMSVPAFAQVPATTGPDVIKDVTGSGRVESEETDAGQGAGDSAPEVATPSETEAGATPGRDETGERAELPAERSAEDAGAPVGEETKVRAEPEPKPKPKPEPEPEPKPERKTQTEPQTEPQSEAGPVRVDAEDDAATAGGDSGAASTPGAAVASAPAEAPKKPAFVVGSWGGAYGQAQRKAVIEPFARDRDLVIERRAPGDGVAGLKGLDVVELSQERLLSACRDGRVLRLSDWPDADGESDVGGLEAGDGDFLVGAMPDGCGRPSFAWSSMLVVNPGAMKALAKRGYREAGSIKSLVDVRRYPGKRALMAEPRRLLEMMLLADGVERAEVYKVLATRAGEDRAFELLEALKDDIIWVSGPRAAFAALDKGRATMAMTFSGRAFRRLIVSDLRAIWDGHVIDYASWAVPRAATRGVEAVQFIRAALKPERMAAQAQMWPYGPMRRSAVNLARRHALLGTELDVFLPTSELRFEQGIVFNAQFWDANGGRLVTRFDDWMKGVPLGIRVPPPRKAPPAPLPPPPRLRSAG